MSLKRQPIPPVPAATVAIARAAFPKGTPYLTLRDELGTCFRDEDFGDLFPLGGQPSLSPWRLALVSILQFRENLSDHQAAEAVRARIDWKYLLGLELTDPGFNFSVLSEFRTRLLAGQAEERLLTVLLEQCRSRGLVKAHGRQRTDSTHVLVLASVRELNRLELIGAERDRKLEVAREARKNRRAALLGTSPPESYYRGGQGHRRSPRAPVAMIPWRSLPLVSQWLCCLDRQRLTRSFFLPALSVQKRWFILVIVNYNQALLGPFHAEPVQTYRRVDVKTLVVILLSSMFLVACGQSESDILANAKKNAEAYAQNLGAGAKVLSCSSQDSDNNGYVSCDIQKGDGTTVPVECSYKRGSSGCKAK